MKKVLWLIVCLMTMVIGFTSCEKSEKEFEKDLKEAFEMGNSLFEASMVKYTSSSITQEKAESLKREARLDAEKIVRGSIEPLIEKYGENRVLKAFNDSIIEQWYYEDMSYKPKLYKTTDELIKIAIKSTTRSFIFEIEQVLYKKSMTELIAECEKRGLPLPITLDDLK